MGINAANFPYFICMDADSTLQVDSLKNVVRPILEDERIVAYGGIVRVVNGTTVKNGMICEYHMPKKLLAAMQVLEYDCSFLASRIFFEQFNGDLIISGAFGLFKKDPVFECGGYDTTSVGEDFELVTKIHVYCRSHQYHYWIKYIPEAVCWTQAPETLKELCEQRKRWNIGLFQSMMKYRNMFANPKYGLVSFISYLYFLLYELFSPFIELFGIYAGFSSILSINAFLARVHVQNLDISFKDILKEIIISIFEITILTILVMVRFFSFFDSKKKKET